MAAYEIDEERDGGVEDLLLVVDEAVWLVDVGEQLDGWL